MRTSYLDSERNEDFCLQPEDFTVLGSDCHAGESECGECDRGCWKDGGSDVHIQGSDSDNSSCNVQSMSSDGDGLLHRVIETLVVIMLVGGVTVKRVRVIVIVIVMNTKAVVPMVVLVLGTIWTEKWRWSW